MILMISACQQQADDGDSCEPSNETCLFNVSGITYHDDEGALPYEAMAFDTNLALINFTVSQQDKITRATEAIKLVVASEEFREAVLNHTYNGQKTFVDNGGLSNSQIYHRFLLGAEQLSPTPNSTIDAEIELYYEDSSTIGHTNPKTRRIWVNTKYFNIYTPSQVAGNLTHEWMHKLGFGHSATSTPSRPYSVPYAIGYLINKLSRQYL